MIFKISQAEVKKREKNILLGVLFSFGLAGALMLGNDTLKITYNSLLLTSIVLFFVFANFFNGLRHLKWKKIIQIHRLEILDDKFIFSKGDEKSTLTPEKIKKIRLKRQNESVRWMIIFLTTGNKIRLEGYDEMDVLAKLIITQLKPEQVVE